MSETASRIAFAVSIFTSLVFVVSPAPFKLPDWLSEFRPDWLILCWFFWLMVQPQRCSLLLAFIVGLFADVLLDEPIGLNSTILLLLIFLGTQALRIIAPSPGLRSTVVILVLCFLMTVIKALVMRIAFEIEIQTLSLIVPPLSTTLFWLLCIPALTASYSQLNEELE